MKKKLLLAFLVTILVALVVPAVTLAADETIDDAYITANPGPYDLAVHTPGDVITITTSQPVTLFSTVSPIAGIQIVCTGNVDLSIDSVFVNCLTYNVSPLTFTGTGNTVTVIGNSILVADYTQPGIRIEAGAEVTFEGNNTGTQLVGQSGDSSDDGTGTAAGIGGGDGNAAGTIIINGSDIQGRATGQGAGVGGGNGAAGGTVTVNDGWLEGYSYGGGAGIGGGMDASGATFISNGGRVTAEATGGGAGVGGGARGEGGVITINDGDVWGSSLSSGAGIGGGNSSGADGSGNAGTITIEGGTVRGESTSGAGIGSGYLAQTNTGSITITGGDVTGTASNNGAGIGGGAYSSAGTIDISGGEVTATSTSGRGLGSGDFWGGGSLAIDGLALVYADGDVTLADIGSSFSSFTISGDAEVFAANGNIDGSLVTTHAAEPGTELTGGDVTGAGAAYLFTSPSGWESALGGYFAERTAATNPRTGDSRSNILFVLLGTFAAIVAAFLLIKRKMSIQ